METYAGKKKLKNGGGNCLSTTTSTVVNKANKGFWEGNSQILLVTV